MKKMKNFYSIFIVSIVFTVIIIMVGIAIHFAEKLFPSYILSIKKDLLFIGVQKELHTLEADENFQTNSLAELLSDTKTTFNNSLALISSNHPINTSLNFSSVSEYKDSDVYFDSSAHNDYSNLSEYIYNNFNQKLYVMSAYRTSEEQKELFLTQGPDTAQRPGESEHQSGLALDVYISGYAGASFLKTDIGKYINAYCHKYGFIIRYPDDKKAITGIDFEPWHIRYVGHPHASVISLNQITLEEYLDSFLSDVYYSYKNYIIVKTSNTENIKCPENYLSVVISPDNCGNYIFTFEMETFS